MQCIIIARVHNGKGLLDIEALLLVCDPPTPLLYGITHYISVVNLSSYYSSSKHSVLITELAPRVKVAVIQASIVLRGRGSSQGKALMVLSIMEALLLV